MATLVTNDGTKIFYTIRGAGSPALVFIHGWCSNLTHWSAQTRRFGKAHRVLAFDRRGHGRSDIPSKGYSAKQHAADLAEIARREKIRRAVVIGHAGGGPTALEFARSYPSLARAVVLVDSTIGPRARIGDPSDPAGAAFGAILDQLDGEDGSTELEKMYAGFFGPDSGSVGRKALAEALETPIEVAIAEMRSLTINTQAIARKLEQPVLWISVDAADQASIARSFRNVQFGQTVGSGHFPHLEVPLQINAMIERFLETL
jgi:pimeloyl-ACP methyl ester carboxylesterase